jgi:hypothetical protein
MIPFLLKLKVRMSQYEINRAFRDGMSSGLTFLEKCVLRSSELLVPFLSMESYLELG